MMRWEEVTIIIAGRLQECIFTAMPEHDLIDAINQTMPFGKYRGRKLLELPEPYLVWFHARGFPPGRLGEQLALIYEVKLNGLELMLQPLLKSH